MNNGKFIVVEGIEGSGKTNSCLLISKILKKNNIKNIICVRQPGSTPISEKIRCLIKKNHKEKLINTSELLLMYAARIQLVENIIKPALKKGTWVISDRHDLSSFAYQGGGGNIDTKKIFKLHKILLGKFQPHLTFYLDVDPKIGLQRVHARGNPDRIENNKLIFFIRTREKYLELIKSNPNIITINTNQNIEIVRKILQKKLKNWLKKNAYKLVSLVNKTL
ncbi:dTMP kinase [Buchnera aphidicola (Pemphigus obesinymphae)]|uniref:dTMP kinase n=1 Tax=Buchnera aphidicola TaxID=9 RepID=UPI0022388B6C|nr:dTMP kinase [Buchnera aphidicola]MCW5196602.1 dTMP kinase [Buchnera aphidicola (Pemphigus obesinymphae)]